MKINVRILLALVVVAGLLATVQAKKADQPKEVTLKGTFVCTKCELGETDECANAIKVKVDDKTVVYYLKDKGNGEKYHKKFCDNPVKGSVKGVVTEKDKKNWITPSKDGVKFD